MKTTNDVKDYILNNYPLIRPNKFQVVKIGTAINLFIIDQNINLQKIQLIRSHLSVIDETPALKKELEKNIKNAMIKYGYYKEK